MARALHNLTVISSLLSHGIPAVLQRRGYAVAADVARQSCIVEEKAAMSVFAGGKHVIGSHTANESAGSWIPDPITGYYRPLNNVAEVDAADLRKALLCKHQEAKD